MRVTLGRSLQVALVVLLAFAGPFAGREDNAFATIAQATAPNIFVQSTHIGWKVGGDADGDVCQAAYERCQSSRTHSSAAGGFRSPASVASDPRTGLLYVADTGNARVQELTWDGRFLMLFGGDVNGLASDKGQASQRDVCRVAQREYCRAGKLSYQSGDLAYPESVAVDPRSGVVYVVEAGIGHDRLDAYAPDGRLLWQAGKSVDLRTGGNLCHARSPDEIRVCGPAGVNSAESLAPGAFQLATQSGDLVAVGGPGDLVYVGDEHRVQVFDKGGRWQGEVLLASASSAIGSAVTSIAVDERGYLYLVYRTGGPSASEGVAGESDSVRVFGPDGLQTDEYEVSPRLGRATSYVDGIALDRHGRLAVIGVEVGDGFHRRFGYVYEANDGSLIGEFTPPQDNDGLTFTSSGDIYVAATDYQEIIGYAPVAPFELASDPSDCPISPPRSELASFLCLLDSSQLL